MPCPSREHVVDLVAEHAAGDRAGATTLAVPIAVRLLADQLTPVLVYRRLVAEDQRLASSFLFESVEGGERAGRYSIMGHRPRLELTATGSRVELAGRGVVTRRFEARDPVDELRRLGQGLRLLIPEVDRGVLPGCLLGGWVGMMGYDTVRYAEPGKLPWQTAPADDRGLPDVAFGLYDGVTVFDQVARVVHVVRLVMIELSDLDGLDGSALRGAIGARYDEAAAELEATVARVESGTTPMRIGRLPDPGDGSGGAGPAGDEPLVSNLSEAAFGHMVERALEYIRAGDIFQVVLGQRFERRSAADPFDVYRALRAVNPSPYMAYLQCPGSILVSSSPEILCRVRRQAAGVSVVTNRPLAGTRPRGASTEEDLALEAELLADPKERAEHVMLVDLGRNDVGRVARPGSIRITERMAIERYSHVMHISSNVEGELLGRMDCWDALRAALPVGTISGAPKIRAMQIIDELETVRRGPYGGGLGWIGLDGDMDIALALRTIVVPTADSADREDSGGWVYHLQAAAGIVADSLPQREHAETVHKAAAMARAIDLAERAFAGGFSLAMTPTAD